MSAGDLWIAGVAGGSRWNEGEAVCRRAGNRPAGFVAEAVMGTAEEEQVVQVSGAAVHPVLDVMAVGPLGRAVAAGEPAAAIPDGQRTVLGARDGASGSAEVEEAAGSRSEEPRHASIATDPAGGVWG